MNRRRYRRGSRTKRRRWYGPMRNYGGRKRYGRRPSIRIGGRARSLLISVLLTVAASMFWYGPAIYDHITDEGLLPWSSGIRTITYAAEIQGGTRDAAVRESLEIATRTWDGLNPDLEFEYAGDRPMTRVVFSDRPVIGGHSYYHGLATCQSTWHSMFNGGRCVIDVYVPGTGGDAGALTTVIMHEFGHVLGLGHTLEPDHLMFTYEGSGDEFLVEPFDDLGYVIPSPIR